MASVCSSQIIFHGLWKEAGQQSKELALGASATFLFLYAGVFRLIGFVGASSLVLHEVYRWRVIEKSADPDVTKKFMGTAAVVMGVVIRSAVFVSCYRLGVQALRANAFSMGFFHRLGFFLRLGGACLIAGTMLPRVNALVERGWQLLDKRRWEQLEEFRTLEIKERFPPLFGSADLFWGSLFPRLTFEGTNWDLMLQKFKEPIADKAPENSRFEKIAPRVASIACDVFIPALPCYLFPKMAVLGSGAALIYLASSQVRSVVDPILKLMAKDATEDGTPDVYEMLTYHGKQLCLLGFSLNACTALSNGIAITNGAYRAVRLCYLAFSPNPVE